MIADFPSTAFINKYYGFSIQMTPRGLPDIKVMRHTDIRRANQYVCINGPRHLIRKVDRAGEPLEPIYVFKDGELSGWAKETLIRKDMLPRTPSELRELLNELSSLLTLETPLHDPWWEWFYSGGSVGVRITPEANPNGGNQPRVSLKELLFR